MIYGLHLHASGKSFIPLPVIKQLTLESASIYLFCLLSVDVTQFHPRDCLGNLNGI